MKVAIIGSRTLEVSNLDEYLPNETTEIISGGAKGIDRCAKAFAVKNNIRYTEFLPEYSIYGKSRGTRFVIENCRKMNKPLRVLIKTN